MYFQDKLMIDNWKPYQMNVMKTFRAKMEKGKEYKIKIEYADSISWAGIRFQWKRDDSDQETLKPDQMLAKAVEITRNADVTIVYAGISANLEGEEMSVNVKGFKGGDKTNLELPEDQEKLLKALKATGKPIILVLTSGSALAVNWENDNIPAILQAWYPGEEGGNAVADVIFGDYNPAGRLPVTFYNSVNDLPPFEDYSMKGRTYRYFNGKVLYPFGYGLSYTSFGYADLNLSGTSCSEKNSINITFKVTNTGNYDGDEVVQLYVKSISSSQPQPVRSLKAFKRVHIRKGETLSISLPLKIETLKYFDEQKNGFTVEPGKYELHIGSSSGNILLKSLLIVK
jgi:beta-glucosidase